MPWESSRPTPFSQIPKENCWYTTRVISVACVAKAKSKVIWDEMIEYDEIKATAEWLSRKQSCCFAMETHYLCLVTSLSSEGNVLRDKTLVSVEWEGRQKVFWFYLMVIAVKCTYLLQLCLKSDHIHNRLPVYIIIRIWTSSLFQQDDHILISIYICYLLNMSSCTGHRYGFFYHI